LPAPPTSTARHSTSRRPRRSRLRQRGRPPRLPAPTSYASFVPPYAGRGCVPAAFPHRRVEKRETTRGCRRGNAIRVDKWVSLGRVRKVPHAVIADALSERESRSLFLGASLAAREPRRLQVLARAERVRERPRARVQRRAVRYRVDGQCTRRVGVRKRAETVGAHALGELHRLGTSRRRAACATAGSARDRGGVIAADASTTRADRDDHKCGRRPGRPYHYWPPVCSARRWPHVCVAALRMVMPPGLLDDGM